MHGVLAINKQIRTPGARAHTPHQAHPPRARAYSFSGLSSSGTVLLGRAGVLPLGPVLQGRVPLPWPGETGTAPRLGGSILRLEKAGGVLPSLLPVCLIFH